MSDPLPNRCLPGKVPSTHMMAGAKHLSKPLRKPSPSPSPGAQLTEADVRRIVREELGSAAADVRQAMLRFQAGP